jgi:hypothetical protein
MFRLPDDYLVPLKTKAESLHHGTFHPDLISNEEDDEILSMLDHVGNSV